MKQSLQERMNRRKLHRPPALFYQLLGGVWKLFFFKKYGIQVTFKTDFRKEKGPYLLISNHASRIDYVFMALPLLPNRYNFVVGYNEFFRSHLSPVLRFFQAIPKKNFTPDLYTIKEINRILQHKGKIILFPEGMSSISGANQPVVNGTGKLIRHFRIPVYSSIIRGGYLTSPKYNLTERPGHVEVEYDRLFSPEEIDQLTDIEIEDRINRALYHDDYEWNLRKQYHYQTGGETATNLHDLLFWCPRCHREFTMIGSKDTIVCSACGNGATVDDTYALHPLDASCVIPATQTEWFRLEREKIAEEIQNPDFELREKIQLGTLPEHRWLKKQKTSEITGEGELILNHEGLTFRGTNRGEPLSFHLSTNEVPTYGMCTDVSRFYTFYDGEFFEFYPETHCVEKWFLATEELHRYHGGKWQDFKKGGQSTL